MEELAQDLIIMIASNVTIFEYHRLKISCKRFYAILSLSSKPCLTFQKYKESFAGLVKLCGKKGGGHTLPRDASLLMRVDFHQSHASSLDSVFLFLIKHGHESEFKRLLSLPQFSNLISADAITAGVQLAFQPEMYSRISPAICMEAVFLVEDCVYLNECFILACSVGDVDVITRLLQKSKLDVSSKSCLGFRTACKKGNVRVVELLLGIKGIDPSAEHNYSFQWAATNNQVEVIRLLLQDGRADPGANMQLAIRLACKYNNIEVVELLLTDERVDAGIDYNTCIREAAMKNRVNLVKILLQNPRVNPADRDNFALRAACLNGHMEIASLLLLDCRVNPADEDYQALRWSVEKGHAEIVTLLLECYKGKERIPVELELQISLLFGVCTQTDLSCLQSNIV